MSWQTEPLPAPLDDRARAAAAACVRLSGLFRRVGLDSAWRFRSGDGRAFALAIAHLEGGEIHANVGFEVDDLALAAEDDASLQELARQAIGEWRQRHVK